MYTKKTRRHQKSFTRDVLVQVRIMLNGIGKLISVSATNVCRRDRDVLLNILEDTTGTAFSLLSSTKLLSHEKTPTRQKRTSGSLRTTSKQDTATTSHHSVTQRTETPLNSANTSGLLKTTTSTTLSPGAFYLHTCRTTAQANDATYVLKKNSLSSADLNSLHLTNVMNSCLPAATETKPSCATTDVTNLALNKLCKSV